MEAVTTEAMPHITVRQRDKYGQDIIRSLRRKNKNMRKQIKFDSTFRAQRRDELWGLRKRNEALSVRLNRTHVLLGQALEELHYLRQQAQMFAAMVNGPHTASNLRRQPEVFLPVIQKRANELATASVVTGISGQIEAQLASPPIIGKK